MAIEIKFLSNIVSFLRGTDNMGDALDGVGDSLDDVARDAQKAASKIGDELADEVKDGAKDAEKSVERLEKSFKELADESKRSTGSAGDAMKRNTKDATTQAQRDLAELKDEALQNASETFSSFDGSMESFADGIQGTFGGIVSNMGPLGAALGAAGALGIGLWMSETEKAKESAQEFREEVAEIAGVLIETGGEGSESIQAIADRLKRMALETDEGAMSLDKLRAMASDLKVPFKDLAQAYVDGGGDIQTYVSQLDKRIEAEQRAFRESTKYTEGATIGTTALGLELEKQRSTLKGVAEQYAEAEEDARLWAESGGAAFEARAEQMDALQGELDDAMGLWKDYEDAEDGALDPAGYLAAMRERMDATANFSGNVQRLASEFGLTFEEQQAIIDQGLDFAPMLQAIMSSGMSEEYAGQIRSMLTGGQSIIDGTPLRSTVTATADTTGAIQQLEQTTQPRTARITPEVDQSLASQSFAEIEAPKRSTVTVDADTGTAQAQIAQATTEDHTAKITAKADTTQAARDLAAVASQSRTATITARADTSAAQRAINDLVQSVPTTVYVDVVERRQPIRSARYNW